MTKIFKKEEIDSDLQEWAGDGFAGAPSFQGMAYGYGGRAQLAGPPTPYPPDFEQVIDGLVSDELNDMFGGSEKPIWTRENKNIQERNSSDANYHDLPGFPATNTLVAKQNYVPVDPAEQDNVDFLGPTVNGMALSDIPNNTANNWKATTPEKRGKQIIDIDALVKNYALPEGMISGAGLSPGSSSWSGGQLVAQKDWSAEKEENAGGDGDANNPLGGMGVIVKPERFIPDSAENQVRMEIINPQGRNMSKKDPKSEEQPLEEVEQVGAPDLNQKMIDQMTALSKRYGGRGLEDYAQVVPPAEQQKMIKQGDFNVKLGGIRQAHQDRATRQKIAAAQKNAPLVQGLKGLAGQQPKQDVKFFPPPPLKNEAHAATVGNPDAADELTTFILNNPVLYERGIKPVILNLRKKMVKGSYNPDLALKLWFYVTTAAAKEYAKEFGMDEWQQTFNAGTRRDAAEALALHFSQELQGK